jgi:hypothetical protein
MRHSPKQDLSQERLHGLGSEESFVPRCLRREWSSRERREIEKAPQGEKAGLFIDWASWEKGSERAKPGELVNRFDSRYTLTENELYRKLVRWSGTCSRRWLNYYATWRRTRRLWCNSSIPKVVFSVIRTLTVETEAAQSQRSSKNPRLLAASPVTAEPSRFGGFCTLVGDEAI